MERYKRRGEGGIMTSSRFKEWKRAGHNALSAIPCLTHLVNKCLRNEALSKLKEIDLEMEKEH